MNGFDSHMKATNNPFITQIENEVIEFYTKKYPDIATQCKDFYPWTRYQSFGNTSKGFGHVPQVPKILYHSIANIQKHTAQPIESFIDIGCGFGYAMKMAHLLGIKKTIGFELRKGAVRHCRKLLKIYDNETICIDITDSLTFPFFLEKLGENISIFYMYRPLHDGEALVKILENIARVMKTGSYIIASAMYGPSYNAKSLHTRQFEQGEIYTSTDSLYVFKKVKN